MRYLFILIIATLAVIQPASARVTGEQYATCAGHYLTAGVITAIEDDEENKIYYTLLALMTANRSYDLMGYEQSRLITDHVIQTYGEMMEKRQDFMRPLITNVERCDKLASRR